MTVEIRPLAEADVDAAREVQTRAFQEHDQKFGEPVTEVTQEVVDRQRRRLRHFLAHDPAGSWVASVDGTVVGVALALKREGLWGLSLLVVEPGHQSVGVGKSLLDASLDYAADADRAIILSSRDPRAMRRYFRAGFDLHPQVYAAGALDRAVLPAPDPRVRAGSLDDAPFADEVDRAVRGAARGVDHETIAPYTCMFVAEDGADRGYGYVRPGGSIACLAATSEDLATAILWQCLAVETESAERDISHITAGQQWAVRVAVAARLPLKAGGPVFWRGGAPPACYLPDGAYL